MRLNSISSRENPSDCFIPAIASSSAAVTTKPTSYSSVAAFEFSSVSNSYANLRHGDTRNVGVIGLAVFTQKGVDPWKWSSTEIQRRSSARAFSEAP